MVRTTTSRVVTDVRHQDSLRLLLGKRSLLSASVRSAVLMKELVLPRIAIDTREQLRYVFDGYESYRTTLATGDYSLEGFETVLAVERKNHGDAWGCLTEGRKRFERCL